MADIAIAGTSSQRPASGVATGWTYFAALMMMLIGTSQAMAGLFGILDDEFLVATRQSIFQFHMMQWAWIHLIWVILEAIHLIWGSLVAVAGAYLLTGSLLARTVGMLMAIGAPSSDSHGCRTSPSGSRDSRGRSGCDLGVDRPRTRHRR